MDNTTFLFEQFLLKFSASYISYRINNYPNAWAVNSLSYAEDFQRQHIKLLYKDANCTDYALIFEHEGSVYVVNDRAFTLVPAVALSVAGAGADFTLYIDYWYKQNLLFKLSPADFECIVLKAKDFEEFVSLCKQIYKTNLKGSFYSSLKEIIENMEKER